MVPISGDLSKNDEMRVVPNGEMTVSVGRGKAWFNHTWSTNDTPYVLELEPAHGVYDRYDAIVLEVRSSIEHRKNSLKVLTGTASANPQKPVLSNVSGFYQHALAYVLVHASATYIDVEDVEDMVGTQQTPYARAISDDVALRIANNLDVPADQDGFILDARQGKILNDKKIDKTDIVNNFTTETPGKPLDASRGAVLYNIASRLDGQLTSNRHRFQFAVEHDVYGYKKDGVFTPFRSAPTIQKIHSITSKSSSTLVQISDTNIDHYFYTITGISIGIDGGDIITNCTYGNIPVGMETYISTQDVVMSTPSISIEGQYLKMNGFINNIKTAQNALVLEYKPSGDYSTEYEEGNITLTLLIKADFYYIT